MNLQKFKIFLLAAVVNPFRDFSIGYVGKPHLVKAKGGRFNNSRIFDFYTLHNTFVRLQIGPNYSLRPDAGLRHSAEIAIIFSSLPPKTDYVFILNPFSRIPCRPPGLITVILYSPGFHLFGILK